MLRRRGQTSASLRPEAHRLNPGQPTDHAGCELQVGVALTQGELGLGGRPGLLRQKNAEARDAGLREWHG